MYGILQSLLTFRFGVIGRLCSVIVIEFSLSENFQFLELKFSIYLNRRVFVMITNFHIPCIL